jgi:UDP-3-O-[3-hydroxymyristoyl] N-acetylglucosamine deacetylase
MALLSDTAASLPALEGTSLIAGRPVGVCGELGPWSPGDPLVTFLVHPTPDHAHSPVKFSAALSQVVHTDNGVTLVDDARQGFTLSIVEHCLAAVAMAGLRGLVLHVTPLDVPPSPHSPDTRFELPLLDGSAARWLAWLSPLCQSVPFLESPQFDRLASQLTNAPLTLGEAARSLTVCWRPEGLRVSYQMPSMAHPLLGDQVFAWSHDDTPVEEAIAPARTFGFIEDLPALQARGLARGVSAENTLGLSRLSPDLTSPLRLPLEPLRHKVLDLLGDLMLTGVNPLSLPLNLQVVNGGHGLHVALGKALAAMLDTDQQSS